MNQDFNIRDLPFRKERKMNKGYLQWSDDGLRSEVVVGIDDQSSKIVVRKFNNTLSCGYESIDDCGRRNSGRRNINDVIRDKIVDFALENTYGWLICVLILL